MKKIVYSAPEMEVIEMKYNQLICVSDGTDPGYGGAGEPGVNDPD